MYHVWEILEISTNFVGKM